MIITSYSHLVQVYQDLGPGDVFVGRIPASHQKAVILMDLTARGVSLLPSAMAQMLAASKTAQAFVLNQWMLPHTQVISRRQELMDALGHYARNGIETAVTKQDHLHCGHGVRQWRDLEMLYNCLSLDNSCFPFVLQPFADVSTDLRVIIVGEFCEAYARNNPDGFRMNLAAGGSSRPYALSEAQKELCRRTMIRAQMPYAHIDLMITADGGIYLSEINLNGGLHGACISRLELDRLKQDHLMALVECF